MKNLSAPVIRTNIFSLLTESILYALIADQVKRGFAVAQIAPIMAYIIPALLVTKSQRLQREGCEFPFCR